MKKKKYSGEQKISKPVPPLKKHNNAYAILFAILIGVIAFSLYAPTASYGLIEYDDPDYVRDNDLVRAGLTTQGVSEAMSAIVGSNWHPLTVLSHMADVSIFGFDPGKFHCVNAVLHAFNSILLFLLLFAGTGAFWRSGFVALIFAVHPVNVESVAWISERKNVLSTAFWFAGMLGYILYVKRHRRSWFVFALACCILGLLAKPMLVTFPLTLLLLDYWPLNRFSKAISKDKVVLKRIILEKLPFFIASLIFCIVTVIVQKKAGAVGGFENGFPLSVRFANAAIAIGNYLIVTFFPHGLSIYYPHPGLATSFSNGVVWTLIIVGLSALIIYWKKLPFLVFGWLWFLCTLLPVLGIIQVGTQSRADRYMYVPMIGVLVGVIWTGEYISRKFSGATRIAVGACVGTIVVLAIATTHQVSLWQSGITLFSHAAQVTTNNHIAENNLGIEYGKLGELQKAEQHFNRALAINKKYDRAFYNLANVRRMQGNIPAAIELCEKAVSVNPRYADAFNNLGGLYAMIGMVQKAVDNFQKAIKLKPRMSTAHVNLGLAYLQERRIEDAVKEFRLTLALDPNSQLPPLKAVA